MFGRIVQYCAVRSLVGDVRKLVFRELHKKHEPILQARLGFNSIDEYMRATPEEIKLKQNRF